MVLDRDPSNVHGRRSGSGPGAHPPGLRRVARLGDGWLASGYNTTPGAFHESLAYLSNQLSIGQREPARFPNGLATMWLYVTEDRAAANRMISERLVPLLNRQPKSC